MTDSTAFRMFSLPSELSPTGLKILGSFGERLGNSTSSLSDFLADFLTDFLATMTPDCIVVAYRAPDLVNDQRSSTYIQIEVCGGFVACF